MEEGAGEGKLHSKDTHEDTDIKGHTSRLLRKWTLVPDHFFTLVNHQFNKNCADFLLVAFNAYMHTRTQSYSSTLVLFELQSAVSPQNERWAMRL